MTPSPGSPSSRSGLQVPELVRSALEEDVGHGDVTSEATIPPEQVSSAHILAKEPVVLSGLVPALETFRQVDPELGLDVHRADGDALEAFDLVVSITGRTRSILRAERVALNFLGRLSGIASFTARFVEEISGTGARILDTRKTLPGWRVLEKAAVHHGGGTNHRMGLDDMVLIKDNHARAAGSVGEALRRARALLRDGATGQGAAAISIEIEVGDLDELAEALSLGPDRILLDNMDLATMREAVRMRAAAPQPHPELEASGNLTLDRVRAVAETGVDFLSVGAITHSARSSDFSLRISG